MSVDPLAPEYPMLTPYQFASNTPIQAIDLDGLEASSAIEFMKGFSQPAMETAGQITINISYVLEQMLFKPAILPMIDPTGGDLIYPGLRDQGIQFSQTTYGQAISFYSEVIPGLVSSGEYRNRVVDETGRSVGQFLSDLESGDARAQGYAAGLIAEIAIGGGGPNAGKRLSKAPFGVIDDAIEMAARARQQPVAVVEAGFNPFEIFRKFISTEPNAQSADKIKKLEKAMNDNDLSIYSEPLNTTTVKGKTYILDGHHRFEAAKNTKSKLYTSDLDNKTARKRYPDKMNDIENGEFD